MIDALARAAGRDVSRETVEKLQNFIALLGEESERQNLVSASTLGSIWERHIVDSAQLVRFEPAPGASWVDIGSGGGLPGIVIASIVGGPVLLVEPRRLRAEFLHKAVSLLDLRATVHAAKVERVAGSFDVITARAVAPLPRLIEISHHLSTGKTVWVLPEGRNAAAKLAEARRTWQGKFHVERSVTDADSFIVVGRKVSRR